MPKFAFLLLSSIMIGFVSVIRSSSLSSSAFLIRSSSSSNNNSNKFSSAIITTTGITGNSYYHPHYTHHRHRHRNLLLGHPIITTTRRSSSSSSSSRSSRNKMSNDNDNTNTNNDGITAPSFSWLYLKDTNNKEYRLAYRYYRHVATTSSLHTTHPIDNGDGNGDNDDENDNRPIVLFCNGFRSVSISGGGGTKVNAIKDYCLTNQINFCCFDYRGHGTLSSGNFQDMTLSDWIQDTQNIITHVLAGRQRPTTLSNDLKNHKKRIILVGSSMGVWISIHIASLLNNNNYDDDVVIDGILGIAAAPDFIQDLWIQNQNQDINCNSNSNNNSNNKNSDIDNDGVSIKSNYEDNDYKISRKLVQDAIEKWEILRSTTTTSTSIISSSRYNKGNRSTKKKENKLSIQCPVCLLHSKCDEDISWKKSLELSKLLELSTKPIAKTKMIQINNNNNIDDDDGQHDGQHDDSNEHRHGQHHGGRHHDRNDIVLKLIIDGDHRLSRPQDIQLILDTLESIISNK